MFSKLVCWQLGVHMKATLGASFRTLCPCKSVTRALALGVLVACGLVSLAVNAQQATTASPQANAPATVSAPPCPNGSTSADCAAPPPQLTTVVITGTLIARPAAETAEAITVVKADSLKDMGLVTLEQAVDQLTSNVPGVNVAQAVTQYTGGGSYANLRDLGQSKTLVMLDGQRMANNVITGDSVDLNGIPFSAIDSVQVLREGASSTYGSDAIAGVINFITKKNYQGGEINVDYDRPQEAGGGSDHAELSFGHGDLASDGYNFMITGSYSKQNELKAADRSFAATGVNVPQGLSNLNGPTAPWPGSYTDNNGNIWQLGWPACAGNPHLFTGSGYCGYEYSAAVDLLPKSDNASALTEFTKELPANNTLSIQYFYSRSTVVQWQGPQSYSFNMTAAADPTYFPTAASSTCYHECSAPPDLTDPITAGWSDPNNNRIQGDENHAQRVLLTFAGSNGGWDYTTDFDYSVYENTFDVLGGEADYAMIAPDNLLSNLINPFGSQSTAGQALINSAYMTGPLANGKLQHFDIGGHAGHELGDAFNAGTPAALALGFDVTNERISYASTPLAVTLYTDTYYPPVDVSGSRQAAAIFAELDVPMAKSLDVNISDREDRYSDFGETNNGKISVRYQPFHVLTFRGSASTGFRAPSLVDLYLPDQFGAAAGSTMPGPPCATLQYTTVFSYANCHSQGLQLAGGNTKLQPETSENFDFGIVVEPIINLGITIDYYKILVKNSIQALEDDTIYANPSLFASDYVLNSSGTLTPAPEANTQCPQYTAPTCGYIIAKKQNTGGIRTSGLDLSVQYLLRTPIGAFHADLEGTAITQYLFQEYSGGPQLNLVGWFNNGNEPAIRWQHTLTFLWTSPGLMWAAGISNRFFSSYIDQYPDAAGNPRIVGSQSTIDTFASYKPIQPVTVLFGIRNVFNQIPPFSNQELSWGAGYNPVFSDPLLRTFYVNLKYQF